MRKWTSLLVIALAISLGACTSTQDATARRLIVTAAKAQRAGADGFKQAKLEQAVSIGRCVSEVNSKGVMLVKNTMNATCEQYGVPLAYNQDLLDKFPKPLAGLYDAAQIAEKTRQLATKDPNVDIGPAIVDLATRLFDFLRDVGFLPAEPKPIENAKKAVSAMIPGAK